MGKPKLQSAIREAEALLRRSNVRATELVAAVHAVNPTSRELRSDDERLAYSLKSRLQSRLILEHFDDLAIELLDSEAGLLSLTYRPQARDACHAILSELEPDARSKVQFQLDTREPQPAHSPRAPAPRRTGAVSAGALQLGLDALAEYDFDRAREAFITAFEAGDDRAALELVRMLVEDLAAWQEALDFGARLESDQLTPTIRSLLANAAAQLGDEASCRRWMSGGLLIGPLGLLAQRALERHDLADATRLVAEVRALAPTAPELMEVQAALEKHRASQREPAERELGALIDSGQQREAEQKARALLAQWPESSFARSIVRAAEARETEARVASLLSDAQSANTSGDHARALALWSEALQLGAPGLEPLIASASAQLEAARLQRERDETLEKLRARLDEPTLSAYVALASDSRRWVRAQFEESALEWLEELGDKPKDLAAVLALSAASRAPLADRHALLAPHVERVRRLEAGRLMLDELAAHAEAEQRREAQAALAHAERALTAQDWSGALALSETPAPPELKERFREVARIARAHVEAAARLQRFDALLAQGRELDALSLLNTERVEIDEARWAENRKLLSLRLRKSLRVQVSDSPSDTSAADFLNLRQVGEPCFALEDGARHAYWVTSVQDRLFVRKISVPEQRIVLTVSLQLPHGLPYAETFVEGRDLWVTGGQGGVVRLDTQTWDVLAWAARPELAGGGKLEGAVTLPGGRFHWQWLDDRGCFRVLDLERGKLHREVSTEGLGLQLVTLEAGARVWATGNYRSGVLYEPGGSVDRTLPAGARHLVRSPTGSGLLAVISPPEVPDDSDEDEGGFRIVHLAEGSSTPQLVDELDDSFNDGIVLLATSVAVAASYAMYRDLDDGYWLVCYGLEDGAVKPRWRVPCPQPCFLFQDLHAQQVVLVAPLGTGLRCLPLTTQEPDLTELSQPHFKAPELSSRRLFCGPSLKTDFLHAVTRIRNVPEAEKRREVDRVCDAYENDPDALAAFATTLQAMELIPEARRVIELVRARFPAPDSAPVKRAEFALVEGDWEDALRIVTAVTTPTPHLEHIRGLALFQLGRLEDSKRAFERVLEQAPHGPCLVQEWPEWIDALLGHGTGPAADFLNSFTRAQAALREKRPREALELLDVPAAWRVFDPQLGARMATAVHDAWVLDSKVTARGLLIVSAFLDECESRGGTELALGGLALNEDDLKGLEERTRRWLGSLSA